VWHASVALQGPRGPVAQVLWGPPEHTRARHLLKSLLDGVGTGPTKVGTVDPSLVRGLGVVALHAKRVLSEDEKATLTPEWCALPAIDQEGGLTLETVNW
jgi:hypothetical protein